MKPKITPPFGDARAARTQGVLTGVGVTLLVVATITLAILLLGVIPRIYDVALQALGSGVEQIPLLGFAHGAGGALLFGVVVAEVLFAVLLSRLRRPGLALLVEGIAVFTGVALLGLALALQTSHALSGLTGSLGNSGLPHVPVP